MNHFACKYQINYKCKKGSTMKLINIGFGNMVSASRLVAIVSPESAPIKRIITVPAA